MPRVVTSAKGLSHTFKPDATDRWETSIAGQAFKYKPEVPFDEPLCLGALFFRPIPKYISNNKSKLDAALNYELLPAKKPDLKNLVASVEDALEGVFYINDSSIVAYIPVNGLPTGKYYSKTPRVEIVLLPLRSFMR
jgi:Holliday junction resolvase RusA-like endonuclease